MVSLENVTHPKVTTSDQDDYLWTSCTVCGLNFQKHRTTLWDLIVHLNQHEGDEHRFYLPATEEEKKETQEWLTSRE